MNSLGMNDVSTYIIAVPFQLNLSWGSINSPIAIILMQNKAWTNTRTDGFPCAIKRGPGSVKDHMVYSNTVVSRIDISGHMESTSVRGGETIRGVAPMPAKA